VATITFHNAHVANRLSPEDVSALREHIATVNSHEEVVVLQLRADGKHFCSGFDLNLLAKNGGEQLAEFAAMVDALEDARPVTLALLEGGVYGGGTDVALACDFRIGTPRTEMFMPAVRIGLIFYERGLERYTSRLGLNHAKRLLLTAEQLDAEAMLHCGFLTHLVSVEGFEAAVQHLFGKLLSSSPIALCGMKKHLNRLARRAVDAAELRRDVMLSANSADLRDRAAVWLANRAAHVARP
jgi:enoyl-CoA hydratase/carnithine racemase